MSDASLSVSAILLSCNCEAFIADALRSALAQDVDPMELWVSDDASEDATFEVVQRELARDPGPHRVRLRRRSTNAGSKSAHLNDVMPRASGDILVFFDGDDVSEPARVRKLVEVFRRDPRVQAVYSGYRLIDEAGRGRGLVRVSHPPRAVNTKAWFARVDANAAGATLAVRRTVVERFGALDPGIYEDIVLPFRASLLGEVAFIDEPLVNVRRHGGSLTTNLERFASIERYRTRLLQGIERARRHADSRFADIGAAASLLPDQADTLRELREIVAASLAAAESTADLVSLSLPSRVRALVKLLRSGAYADELAQNACLALIPRTYLRYKRRSLGVGRRRHVASGG